MDKKDKKDKMEIDSAAETEVTKVVEGEPVEDTEGKKGGERSLPELLAMMKEMMNSSGSDDDDDDDDDDEDDEEEAGMDADDFHNKAVDYARHSQYRQAARLCMRGLKRFPQNVDLLADTIKYSTRAGDPQNAEKHCALLGAVPMQRWNWRAFTFSFDYLLEADVFANEAQCREIVAGYRKYLPFNEKAAMAESELESALGNHERSLEILREAVRERTNAAQCSLRLADMEMERGNYEAALAACNYGIAASAEAQPSINVPYLLFVRALAKDHLLHRRACEEQTVPKEEVETLANEYELLLSEFPAMKVHGRTINLRAKMLKFIRTA